MTAPQFTDTPEAWDAAGPGYAERIAPLLMEAFAEEFVERLAPSPDARAVEVGAGSGALTLALAPCVASLTATDFAPAMVEILRARVAAVGASHVDVRVMDGQALDLPDAGYDCAACSFALMLFPDRARGFAELRRVLRPGGRALVSGWADPERFQIFGLLLDGMRAAFPDAPPPDRPPPVLSLADPDRFRAEMEAAGFRDVAVGLVDREMALPGFEDVWEMMTAGAPPVRALLDRVGEVGQTRLHGVLRDIVTERFGDGPILLTNTATVAVGRA